jgi:hypothetical protein
VVRVRVYRHVPAPVTSCNELHRGIPELLSEWFVVYRRSRPSASGLDPEAVHGEAAYRRLCTAGPAVRERDCFRGCKRAGGKIRDPVRFCLDRVRCHLRHGGSTGNEGLPIRGGRRTPGIEPVSVVSERCRTSNRFSLRRRCRESSRRDRARFAPYESSLLTGVSLLQVERRAAAFSGVSARRQGGHRPSSRTSGRYSHLYRVDVPVFFLREFTLE